MSLRPKMSRKSRKQVSFIPEADTEPIVSLKQPGRSRTTGSRFTARGSCTSRMSKDLKFYPVSFLKRVGSEVLKALSCECVRRKPSGIYYSDTLARSMSVAETIDSRRHRAEAIEECIDFLYASSSLQRSHSVSVSTCPNFGVTTRG